MSTASTFRIAKPICLRLFSDCLRASEFAWSAGVSQAAAMLTKKVDATIDTMNLNNRSRILISRFTRERRKCRDNQGTRHYTASTVRTLQPRNKKALRYVCRRASYPIKFGASDGLNSHQSITPTHIAFVTQDELSDAHRPGGAGHAHITHLAKVRPST